MTTTAEARGADDGDVQRSRPRRQPRRRNLRQEASRVALAAILLSLLLRAFVVQAFYIPSGSMERTLHGCLGCRNNDRVVVLKLGYRFHEPRYGDVVVFDGRGSFTESEQEVDYIKRVIGLPGDTVSCCDPDGRLMRNGDPLVEPYLADATQQPFAPVTVLHNRLWLMGDNRNHSADSRYHGLVPVDRVLGRAFLKIWPPSRIGGL